MPLSRGAANPDAFENWGVVKEDPGTAGASARREYERRRARDESRIREKWGRLGGIAVVLSEEKQSTRAWSTGASGEEVVGQRLDRLASDDIRVLHDRRLPNSRANVDHLVVTAAGVWVVDTKKYKGRPRLSVEGGLARPRVEKLLVNGRDKSALADSVARQIELVGVTVPGVPLRGALCFVGADWPLVGGDFTVRGIEVLWPRELEARIRRAKGTGVDVGATAAVLAAHFRTS